MIAFVPFCARIEPIIVHLSGLGECQKVNLTVTAHWGWQPSKGWSVSNILSPAMPQEESKPTQADRFASLITAQNVTRSLAKILTSWLISSNQEGLVNDLITSIMTPGYTAKGVIRLMYQSFYALFFTLFCLLLGTKGNFHVLALLIIAICLFVTLRW